MCNNRSMKREAQFTTRFKKWLHVHALIPSSGAYELKVTTTKRIPFTAVTEHQVDALMAVKTGKFIYKIPDAGWQNPFDVIMMSGQPAWVVLGFQEPRKKTQTYIIDIELFLQLKSEMEEMGIKSTSQDQLNNYCKIYPKLCQCHSI